jgi:hypothetical protein
MNVSFDIFRMGHEGSLSWVEMAATLKDARERVHLYAGLSPAVYFILSQPDGDLEIVEPDVLKRAARSVPTSVWTNN